MKPPILLVDDDDAFLRRLGKALERRGFLVAEASGVADAKRIAGEKPDFFHACVVDLRMPDGSGLEFVHWLNKSQPECRILVLTGFGSIATAVEAIKLGAADYLTKPADADQILAALMGRLSNEKADPASETGEFPSLDRVEWEHLQRVLRECGGNVSLTAKVLGIERRTLQRKLQKFPPPR